MLMNLFSLIVWNLSRFYINAEPRKSITPQNLYHFFSLDMNYVFLIDPDVILCFFLQFLQSTGSSLLEYSPSVREDLGLIFSWDFSN